MTSLQGTTVHDQRKGVLHQNEQIKSVLGHFRAQKLHVRVRVSAACGMGWWLQHSCWEWEKPCAKAVRAPWAVQLNHRPC